MSDELIVKMENCILAAISPPDAVLVNPSNLVISVPAAMLAKPIANTKLIHYISGASYMASPILMPYRHTRNINYFMLNMIT